MQNSIKSQQIVTFLLGKDLYAFDIHTIREVINYKEVRAIPQSPDFIDGVIDVRDILIPVINLEKRLGIEGGQSLGRQRIIIVEKGHLLIGVIVNDISQVLRIDNNQSGELAPELIADIDVSCINRIIKSTAGIIIVLDVNRLITKKESNLLETFHAQFSSET